MSAGIDLFETNPTLLKSVTFNFSKSSSGLSVNTIESIAQALPYASGF